MQSRARVATGNQNLILPLAIMTSGDTHEATVKLLKEHKDFGMVEGQLTIVKQEKVPSLLDNDARFALEENDNYEISTKPHGHGDVHTLLHQYGVVNKWVESGIEWIVFFQDTNGVVFRAIPAALGVSKKNDFEVNSLTVPRSEAVGGICKLSKKDGSSITINVEYNQLDPLLRETISKEGDVPDATGFSPFPGNINVLVFKAKPYRDVLQKTGGSVPEFVNPKYKDNTKTTFKKPTRLECMMQDYPKLLGAE
jgi:UDP-sugar pyrophosphorylase